MSKQQLDYASEDGIRGNPLWQRATIGSILLTVSFAVTPIAVHAAWLSAGGGHGSYSSLLVLFPWPIWTARFTGHDLSGLVEKLMYAQFPIYGLIAMGCAMRSRRSLWLGTTIVLGLHVVAVACEYIVGV
jgi:hypothetical protein